MARASELYELTLVCDADAAREWAVDRDIALQVPLGGNLDGRAALASVSIRGVQPNSDAGGRLVAPHDIRRVTMETAILADVLARLAVLFEDHLQATRGENGRFYRATADGATLDVQAANSFFHDRETVELKEPGLVVFEVRRIELGSPIRLTVNIRYNLAARSAAAALSASTPVATAGSAAAPPVAAISTAAVSTPASAVLTNSAGGFWAVKNIGELSGIVAAGVTITGAGFAAYHWGNREKVQRASELKSAIRAEASRGEYGTLQSCLREAGFYDAPRLSLHMDGYTVDGARRYMEARGMPTDLPLSHPDFIDALAKDVSGL